jgi:UDP-N-acetylmuramyl pentapeptide phosphotransferase/UDP-N-acetylglucosamine-1-phosphate transferase
METTDFIPIIGLPIAPWLINGLLVLAFSIILTGILIPKILLISLRKNLFDIPDERKIHHVAVPRLGGMAFMPAIILSISIVTGINFVYLGDTASAIDAINLYDDAVPLCFGLCALMMLYLVGIADDLIGVKYRAKFVVQIIAALLIVSSGMSVTDLGGFFGLHELPVWLSTPLTVVLIVLIVNAVNLIDGIDGLASGLSAIALSFYAFVCFYSGDYAYAMLSLAALGTLIPFFYYNVFGDVKVGKKIFMGDTGALTTGLVLSFVAIKVSNNDVSQCPISSSATVLAFSPLVVPCLDVVRVFFHRLCRRQSPFLPGRTHIHHKLLALGIRQHIAMLSILGVSAAYIVINLLLSSIVSVDVIILLDLLIWVLGNLWLTKAIRRRQQQLPETRELYD